MAYKSLLHFINTLEAADELIRIDVPVDPVLEIAELADRQSKSLNGGKALLFTQTGTDFPLLINAFGSEKRMCLALGIESLEQPATEWYSVMKDLGMQADGLKGKLKLLGGLINVGSFMPIKLKGRGACQEIVMHTPNVEKLPVLKCWPADGGRFITLPLVVTRHPQSGIPNLGMYRMQVFGPTLTGMHWHRHKTGANHYNACQKAGIRMPVTVFLGGDPVYTYAATAPLPENIDEFIFAGIIRKKGVRLVKCLTNDHYVPADADIVIEGYVDPAEDGLLEGPFGDHTGFYSLADYYPAFHITCITHRKEAIYPATVVGIPPQEDAAIARATERIFLFPIQNGLAPEVVDMRLPDEGVAHNLALLSIRQSYPGEAFKVMNALWGAGQMMFTKCMVVVDEGIQLQDYNSILKLFFRRFHPAYRQLIFRGPADVLDHSAKTHMLGGKVGIDLTTAEGHGWDREIILWDRKPDLEGCQWTKDFKMDGLPATLLYAPTLLPTQVAELTAEFYNQNGSNLRLLVIMAEPAVADLPANYILWYLLGNMDPTSDITWQPIGDDGWVYVLDARMKPGRGAIDGNWPNIIKMDRETIDLVDRRWNEYFPDLPYTKSPSLIFQTLTHTEGAIV